MSRKPPATGTELSLGEQNTRRREERQRRASRRRLRDSIQFVVSVFVALAALGVSVLAVYLSSSQYREQRKADRDRYLAELKSKNEEIEDAIRRWEAERDTATRQANAITEAATALSTSVSNAASYHREFLRALNESTVTLQSSIDTFAAAVAEGSNRAHELMEAARRTNEDRNRIIENQREIMKAQEEQFRNLSRSARQTYENARSVNARETYAHVIEPYVGGAALRHAVSQLRDTQEGPAGVSLSGWDASGRTILDTDFSGIEMDRTRFVDATLKDIRFAASGLEDADFRYARLENVDFTGADLERARFWKTSLFGCDLSGADLCKADITQEQINACIGDSRTMLPMWADRPAHWSEPQEQSEASRWDFVQGTRTELVGGLSVGRFRFRRIGPRDKWPHSWSDQSVGLHASVRSLLSDDSFSAGFTVDWQRFLWEDGDEYELNRFGLGLDLVTFRDFGRTATVSVGARVGPVGYVGRVGAPTFPARDFEGLAFQFAPFADVEFQLGEWARSPILRFGGAYSYDFLLNGDRLDGSEPGQANTWSLYLAGGWRF